MAEASPSPSSPVLGYQRHASASELHKATVSHSASDDTLSRQATAAPVQMPTSSLAQQSAQTSVRRADQVTYKPDGKCSNYPFCTATQKRPRIDGKLQPRQEHCSVCLANPVCKEDGCSNRVPSGRKVSGGQLTWSPNGRCVEHARADTKSWGILQ